ncbi:unnamed protein product [Dovyalis caffra]|uniref:Uncharacterized protein n=1 Tax=Dovyalis caffra TaxID=77055 RepID=A0AAV1S904_9ROSI|nr:unnamed protein product [Dovyalis caffra]
MVNTDREILRARNARRYLDVVMQHLKRRAQKDKDLKWEKDIANRRSGTAIKVRFVQPLATFSGKRPSLSWVPFDICKDIVCKMTILERESVS